MLTGEQSPISSSARWITAIRILLGVFPLVMMGGAMVLVGLLALGPRRDLADLWICLPGGLALLGILVYAVYYECLWMPALTISHFTLNTGVLTLQTPRYGCITGPVDRVRTITKARSRRRMGRRLKGWWLEFEGVGRVYLRRETSNAEQLLSRLRSALSSNHDEADVAPP